jgi:hypothetical protein
MKNSGISISELQLTQDMNGYRLLHLKIPDLVMNQAKQACSIHNIMPPPHSIQTLATHINGPSHWPPISEWLRRHMGSSAPFN